MYSSLVLHAGRFKGVGTKTVSCVLMFCLGREDFPVDTHVWRITKALGWVPAKATRDQAYTHLSTRVPPDIRRGCSCGYIPGCCLHCRRADINRCMGDAGLICTCCL